MNIVSRLKAVVAGEIHLDRLAVKPLAEVADAPPTHDRGAEARCGGNPLWRRGVSAQTQKRRLPARALILAPVLCLCFSEICLPSTPGSPTNDTFFGFTGPETFP